MMAAQNRLRELFRQSGSVYAKPVTRRIVLTLAFFTLLIVLLSFDFIPDKVSFKSGEISDRDVLAPRTVSYVNIDKTKELEAEVLSGITGVYDLDTAVTRQTAENLAALFDGVQAVRNSPELTNQQKLDKIQEALPSAMSKDTA